MDSTSTFIQADTPASGELLRQWRRRRRLSQLELAAYAEVSQRHLSFLESGRASPSRDMVLHLAAHLEIPLRERNRLLTAAGFAPVYRESELDDTQFTAARQVVERILHGHAPYPALAVDRHWTLLMANEPMLALLDGVDPTLLAPPVNVLRVSLHPDGMAPRIENFREWQKHILARLTQQAHASADPALSGLIDELKQYPVPPGAGPWQRTSGDDYANIAVPLRLRTNTGVLSFLGTTTVFGTPVDITLEELAIEAFFPADEVTAHAMQNLAQE